jgi:hypothetical protein
VLYFLVITGCSPLKASASFGGKYDHLQGRRISQAKNQHEAGSKQSLKMEATYSSETSAEFRQTTECYFPEDRKVSLSLLLNNGNKCTFIK